MRVLGRPRRFSHHKASLFMRVVPSPPGREAPRGELGDVYVTLRRKRAEARAVLAACSAWMRRYGRDATRAQRFANAQRMKRASAVSRYCDARMVQFELTMSTAALPLSRRAGGVPVVRSAGAVPSHGKRKASDEDISDRAHAYQNVGEPDRKRKRETTITDVENEYDEYQSDFRRRFPALDTGVKGLYGPGDFYY